MTNQVVKIENGGKEISIPFNTEDLGDFISGLLGQPQSIEKVFTTPFLANNEYFIHLIELIKQRLEQQNVHEIVSFQAMIGYKDKTRRKFTSIESFVSYSESLNLISDGINLKFGILVHFPKKDIPEKQEIDIDFSTTENDLHGYPRSIINLVLGRKKVSGVILVEVNHTERTWADEILKLIENSLEDITIKEPVGKKIIRSALAPLNIDNVFFAMFLLIPVYVLLIIQTRDKANNDISKYLTVVEKNSMDIQALHQKLDIISNHLLMRDTATTNSLSQSLLIYLISLIFLGILIYVINLFIRTPDSFIVLTKASAQYRQEVLKKYRNKLWVASIFGAICLGLIINYIFNFLQSFKLL
ncbi:hypothetical protein [Psychrobacter namhaensis]|uniref:hypothetical protein n=1 Tax=Psychrobacter namhaensis TaxID=292734 RepID=UPI003CFC9FD6